MRGVVKQLGPLPCHTCGATVMVVRVPVVVQCGPKCRACKATRLPSGMVPGESRQPLKELGEWAPFDGLGRHRCESNARSKLAALASAVGPSAT